MYVLTRVETMREILAEMREDDFRIVDAMVDEFLAAAAWREGVQRELAARRARETARTICYCGRCERDGDDYGDDYIVLTVH
jgi:hypothetical protein